MPEQLRFDWPAKIALGAEDFYLSDANQAAYDMVMAPEKWPLGKLVLCGPPGSGKTHLARVFSHLTGAKILDAAGLGATEFSPPDTADLVIENIDQLPEVGEEIIFHLHNHLARTGGHLLLTGIDAPARWPIKLPDLASRMQASAVATISDPDEVLLAAVVMKQFQDRQLSPTPSVVHLLARNIPRSFAVAARAVAWIDATALERGREINRTLALEFLDKHAGNGA